ncbi:gas vesicle protein GvpL/GvpF [Streptomyces sp. 2333.5]|uniref:GvpL/GvpF family gas vesicle protein n=1 Tax=unclassified Streptomyces TaxID=2593676 RepID=UPI00089C4D8E|nr:MULTISPECIES: GvpL/GvpF family gas vesicle protein [unclassified Streptomyces]PJJ05832.1 gas vesicle protein GvpL/GvpF [Streptomyces sp. 2333.5]SEE85276.1 Gas vesicle synthesis protein GvpL/GvpF [Streptomyces sp. 2314.4]SEF04455.1 Gas vesicle synthesis protein GvpL/GvpF [Streptomyces sp. 2112.2]
MNTDPPITEADATPTKAGATSTEAGATPLDRPDAPTAPGTTVSYVYALSRAGTALDTRAPQLTGLDDGLLRTVTCGELSALVSSVPADAYSEEGIRARLEDLSELAAVARTHHAVIEAAYATTTVLPMRLATVYLDDARVRSMLHERRADFGELLTWLEGHVELGVKVYADPREAAAAPPDPAPATGSASAPVSPGRAYLQQRRAQRRHHRDAYRAAGAVAGAVPDRVSALARARVAHRPQQGDLASGPGENISNEAYLVPAERTGQFHQALTGLADDVPGVHVEITGPWAPYSFATPPTAGAGA